MEKTIKLLKSEGITGAQDLIFMTRYASLTDDKALMRLVGDSMQQLVMPKSPWPTYALLEYFEATGEEFAKISAEYLLSGEENAMVRNKAARVLKKEEYLTKSDDPLALLELYRATYNEEYLNKAAAMGKYIRDDFAKFFNPSDVYDFIEPSSNSCIAVLFDVIARLTQEEKWLEARERQNHLIKLLAEKYPTKVSFGLCALLSDEFGYTTAVVEGEAPESLFGIYSPVTEIMVKPSDGDTKVYIKKDGKLEQIMF